MGYFVHFITTAMPVFGGNFTLFSFQGFFYFLFWLGSLLSIYLVLYLISRCDLSLVNKLFCNKLQSHFILLQCRVPAEEDAEIECQRNNIDNEQCREAGKVWGKNLLKKT